LLWKSGAAPCRARLSSVENFVDNFCRFPQEKT